MIMLPPHYRNYWLDLARKEYEDKQHQKRQKAIQKIADMLKSIKPPLKKP